MVGMGGTVKFCNLPLGLMAILKKIMTISTSFSVLASICCLRLFRY